MTVYNFDTIYLGNFADADPTEGNQVSENAADLLGSYSDIPETQLAVDDADDDGLIYDNEFGIPEDVTYDTGSGTTTSQLDSTVEYMATITRGDGTTYQASVITYQMVNGDLFVLGDAFDGENIQAIELTSIVKADFAGTSARDKTYNFDVVCLTSGTLVQTDMGEKPVEDLRLGDLVETLSDGFQPLLLIGHQTRRPTEKAASIKFRKGCLGPDVPEHDLRVSPQHRMLLTSPIARRMCDNPHAFVAAKKLVGHPGVTKVSDPAPITYWHMLFSRHQAIRANGTWVESLLVAPASLRAMPTLTRVKIDLLRSELDRSAIAVPSYPVLGDRQLKTFMRRSAQNSKPLVNPDMIGSWRCRKLLMQVA